jgi:neutral ceramidase
MLLLALFSCRPPVEVTPEPEPAACDPVAAQADAPAIVPGAPMAGVAEAPLLLPIGTPLSGYTGRCDCFGGAGDADRRDSAYTSEFAASAGVQTAIPVKAFWISNGDQDLVVIKVDVIYSFDGLVEELERRLSAATGRDLDGKVVVATNHSHSSHGDFSDQITFYLGSDRFNYEVFTRLSEAAEDVAMQAHAGLQPAKIGVGYAKDWDPDDRVYRDRRDNNDDVQFFDDIPAGRYKDPNLTMMRIDTLDDQPLGVLFNFGIHGTILGEDNALISVDAPGHVESVFQERFDTPVVVALLQGAAGDASPAGDDDGYARLESVGENAADALESLWASIPTASAPIRLETTSRSVDETHDAIHITRGGTVDLRYTPYVDDEDFEPDNLIYAEDGSLLSPIDEFNTAAGGAFCGEDPAYLPGFAPASVFPYVNCVDVSKMVAVIRGFFDLTELETELPILESRRAAFTASRIGPLPIRNADGSETTDDFFMGFFPGETTATYTEQFRRRAAAELGFEHAMAVGYSQDHEGYLLIPEDWLQGGYEIDINIWGPLQGEYIMEQLLVASEEVLLTDVVETPDPCDLYASTDYQSVGVWELPGLAPEATPEAGTLYATPPSYLWSPLYSDDEREAGVTPDLVVPAAVPRVQGVVDIAWIGGDPGVDYPDVTLERQAEDGSWSTVLTSAGRPVSRGPDILLTHTPDPLLPFDSAQTHTWYATWQAVGHVDDRAGLPVGTYRLHVVGNTYTGASTTYPWDSTEYTVDSATFEVVPAAITVSASGDTVTASLVGPARGWRYIGHDGAYRGNNPLPTDQGSVRVVYGDGTEATVDLVGSHSDGVTLFAGVSLEGAVRVDVTDVYGNTGGVDL